MEVDSVHAKIESKQKNVDLETPADYCRIVKEARRQYDFFKDFEATQAYDSIRPGNKPGIHVLLTSRNFSVTLTDQLNIS
jgi:hypothetical protein